MIWILQGSLWTENDSIQNKRPDLFEMRKILKEKAAGRKVVMIGDGINDSPALSAADEGIAISDGAELAREIADITIAAEDLRGIVMLKWLSDAMMRRIQGNYKGIVSIIIISRQDTDLPAQFLKQ